MRLGYINQSGLNGRSFFDTRLLTCAIRAQLGCLQMSGTTYQTSPDPIGVR